MYGELVRGVVESMNGARFVHDELVKYGWEVLVVDAQRVKGLARLAGKTDKVDARVLAELSFRDLVPAIWLPTPELRAERERAMAAVAGWRAWGRVGKAADAVRAHALREPEHLLCCLRRGAAMGTEAWEQSPAGRPCSLEGWR